MPTAEGSPVGRWRTVPGGRVHEQAFEAAGPDAPVFVLVHGLGVSGRYFLPLGRRLAGSARVLVPDLPGNGRSPKPPRPLDVPGLAAALGGWADAAALPPACFVANSLGCQTVLRLAVDRPELVERIVLVGPTVDASARSFLRQAVRFAATAIHEPLPLVALVAWEYLRAGPLRVLATARHALADRVEERLGAVAAPALVIRGEHDRLCTQAWAERVAAGIPRGELAVVPRRAHAAHYSAPDEVAALVRTFAASAPVSTA
jgi:pimeloyl-ACP methyl ester carboxylesterase